MTPLGAAAAFVTAGAVVVGAWHSAIFAASSVAAMSARRRAARPTQPGQRGEIRNFRAVDDHLWRGGRPARGDYRVLASQGVTTVVDLCEQPSAPYAELASIGLTALHVPIVDGRLPTTDQVTQAVGAITASEGRAFVHCAAGVGRTGTVVASYLIDRGRTTRWQALVRNLEVGPSSLEQLVFTFTAPGAPGPIVRATSRAIDAPRIYFGRLRRWIRSRC